MTPEARLRQRVRFPVLALTTGAWIALLVAGMPAGSGGAAPDGPLASGSSPVAAGATLAHGHGIGASGGAAASPAAVIGSAGLMLVAMMGPLLIPALRHVLDRSLTARRARAAALLTVGYGCTWAVVWLLLVSAVGGVRSVADANVAALVGLLLAVGWQVSPVKQRCLNRCHARPALAAFGSAADRDALTFGLRQAQWCVGACWALMLLPLVLPGPALLTMAAVAAWMWAERIEPPAPARWAVRGPVVCLRIAARQAGSWARQTAGLRSRA